MKIAKTFAALAVIGSLAAGCTTAEKSTAAGAIIGGGATALAGGNTGQIIAGTAVGAAVGWVSYEVLGGGGDCRYRRANGTTYIAACP